MLKTRAGDHGRHRTGVEPVPGGPPDDMPTDYLPGYEQARAIDPEMASRYVAHTLIGDPLAEAAVDDLAVVDRAEAARFMDLGMRGDSRALKAAPASLREFFGDAERQPEWLDHEAFAPGIRAFHRNSYIILMAFVTGVLIEGFTTNIARSFMLTGRVRDKGVRRLGQNNRHMTEIFFPGGLDRQGDGWKLSVRIRMVHARIRRLLNDSEEWDAKAWGTPIKLRPSWVRHRRLFRKAAETHEDPRRQLHGGGAQELHGRLALLRLPDGHSRDDPVPRYAGSPAAV